MKVDWEPLDQIRAQDIPAPSPEYPGPWTIQHRGNGHVDLFDVNGKYFAHVYCWDSNDFYTLEWKISQANSQPDTVSTTQKSEAKSGL